MNNLYDHDGVILSVGDKVCLAERIANRPGDVVGIISRVFPGEVFSVEVEFQQEKGGTLSVMIQSSKLRRINSLVGRAAKALIKDVKKMKSGGEIAIREEPK